MDLPHMSWADWFKFQSHDKTQMIDVRSPKEFLVDHPPKAHSIPLFDDDQRHVVGLLYAKEGQKQAILTAGKFARDRLDLFKESPPLNKLLTDQSLDESFDRIFNLLHLGDSGFVIKKWKYTEKQWVEDLASGTTPVFIYCWRGGMRSKSFTLLLNQLGLRAIQLDDGYKGYRRWVFAQLDEVEVPPCIVVHGMTGAGKTELLHILEKRFPGQMLDLEGLAQHRSSILGDVGLKPSSKKSFDSSLLHWLKAKPRPWIFVEGESRKIGKIPIPTRVWEAMSSGIRIKVTCDASARAKRLVKEYVQPGRQAAIRSRLAFLERRLSQKVGAKLIAAFDTGDHFAVASILLEHYYDPRYLHSQREIEYRAEFDTTDMSKGAKDIGDWLESGAGAA